MRHRPERKFEGEAFVALMRIATVESSLDETVKAEPEVEPD